MSKQEQVIYVRHIGGPALGRRAELLARYGHDKALCALTLRVLRASN